jgi:NADPH2:quinone reductase
MTEPSTTIRAIRVARPGGPEAMRPEEAAVPSPGPGEARVRIEYAGINFIDVYHRTGFYPVDPPFTPGMEAAGTVEAVGPDVEEVREGDRVAYAMNLGAYAEAAIVPAWKLVPVPDSVPLDQAAALILQGLTAHYLAMSTFPLREGHTALVHAAAGGVGLLLIQIANMRGARVIGTVSTEEKAALARDAGAHDVIRYTEEDFVQAVGSMTNGRGVDVVYDSVGQTTFEGSLDSLTRRGYMILFGQSSGPVAPLDPAVLNRKGSLFLTRPTVVHYAADREELLGRTNQLFQWVEHGDLRIRIDRTLPLDQAAEAHRLLEARQTAGKVLLRC